MILGRITNEALAIGERDGDGVMRSRRSYDLDLAIDVDADDEHVVPRSMPITVRFSADSSAKQLYKGDCDEN